METTEVQGCAFCTERLGVESSHKRGRGSPEHLPEALAGPFDVSRMSLAAQIAFVYDEEMAEEDRRFAEFSKAAMRRILEREEREGR